MAKHDNIYRLPITATIGNRWNKNLARTDILEEKNF